MKKFISFVLLLTLSFTSSATITKLNCSRANGEFTIPVTINSQNKTVNYGFDINPEIYQTKGDYIYWTTFDNIGTAVPLFLTYFINLKTGILETGSHYLGQDLTHFPNRHCFPAIDT